MTGAKNQQVGDVDRPKLVNVRAVERAVAIMEAFSVEMPRLGLGEVAERTGLDKNTARRLLHTLEGVGWVTYAARERTYALGAGLMLVQPAVDYERRLREVAPPVLARLTAHTEATSFLWTEFRLHALCVERVRTHARLSSIRWSEPGRMMPVNCSGGPRMILAHMTPERRAEALAGPQHSFTAKSVTDPVQLARDADAIVARGWELAVDDYVIGMAGLSAPVFDGQGRFRAAISITDLTPRIAPRADERPRHLDLLLEATAEVGAYLDR